MSSSRTPVERMLPSEDDPHDSGSFTETSKKVAGLGCIVRQWRKLTDVVHDCIGRFVLTLALFAARNPKRTIAVITVVSFALLAVGFFTNFQVQVDYLKIYAPFNSIPKVHKDWIDNQSGFPVSPRPFTLVFHDNGKNVLGMQQVGRVFHALETIQNTTGYDSVCSASSYINADGQPECKIYGVTRFWNHSYETFQEDIHSDEEAIVALSASSFPGGIPVYTELFLGFAERDGGAEDEHGNHSGTLLTFAKSYLMRIEFPDTDGVEDFEREVLDRLLNLKDQWGRDPKSKLYVNFFTMQSYALEFMRAINKDLILVPFVGLIMSGFTCFVFYKRDRVQSRSMLGIGSVVTIAMSLMTGFGLMFLVGLPFTSMTQILPFVVFGVGLDDTFIITGAYFRTDPKKDTVERIRETMTDVGQSIATTTITTIAAFILGCISSIPAIRWLCLYAFPTIAIDFVYQITYFIALLVLDERRIQANKKDCCIWCVVHNEEDEEEGEAEEQENAQGETATETLGFAGRFMEWYSSQLMKPWVKALVIAAFTAYCAFCAYCTTKLTQEFKTQDFVPQGSYVAQFINSLADYTQQQTNMEVYFRNVNQSDSQVQQEMKDYVMDLMEIPTVGGTEPLSCWVFDFQKFKDDPQYADDPRYAMMKQLTFNAALEVVLSNPAVREAYGDNIVRDEDGNILASRCLISPKHLDLDNVKNQMELLADQREVSREQPINEDRSGSMDFFTFDPLYFIWEFYTAAANELISNTISGVIAVSIVGFFLIPHWSATAFVFPLIIMLYIDMLGTLQFAGLHINVVTYVTMVISIGLLVDFLMHVLLKFYESAGTREKKVKETLVTMGASVLVGGLSTFLGVIPLALSTSLILRTVFTAFFAMVTLGITHGLILLPVILSIFGPNAAVPPSGTQKNIGVKINDLGLHRAITDDTKNDSMDEDNSSGAKYLTDKTSDTEVDGNEQGCINESAIQKSRVSAHQNINSDDIMKA